MSKNSQKLLARTTRLGYDTPMDEIWADLPDLHGYSVSTIGRVRRWVTRDGRAYLHTYRGVVEGSTVAYRLKGDRYTIDDLMRMAFGDDIDYMDVCYDPRDRDRELTSYEESEILAQEGYKPAHAVADNFRIDAYRVRQLWDGGA